VDGEEQEVVDDATLVKLLTQKSIVEPRILRPLGTRLWRQLERDVQVLHFGVEPDETDAEGRGQEGRGSRGSDERELLTTGELALVFAEKFSLDPDAVARWPYHKFRAVRRGFIAEAKRRERAEKRALAKIRGDEPDEGTNVVMEWSKDHFERSR
jgi:hypothetical protein